MSITSPPPSVAPSAPSLALYSRITQMDEKKEKIANEANPLPHTHVIIETK